MDQTSAKYVIGIDGGGTKTQAVLLDDTGRELSRGRSSGANPNTVGRAAAAKAINDAIQAALSRASAVSGTTPTLGSIAGVGIGTAGASGAQAWLNQTLADAVPGAVTVSGHDAEIALVGALGVRRGIVAIAGTGSTVYGMNDAGDEALVDGWGYLLGDSGSGFAIGQAALRVFLYVRDGRAAPGTLSAAVQQHLGLDTRDEIIAWAYGGASGGDPRAHVSEVAKLARVVMELAGQSDPDAQAIIDKTAGELVLSIKAAWQRLKLGKCAVGLAGGVLGWGGPMARAVSAQLATSLPDVTPTKPRSDAATGAAWLAMHALGWRRI